MQSPFAIVAHLGSFRKIHDFNAVGTRPFLGVQNHHGVVFVSGIWHKRSWHRLGAGDNLTDEPIVNNSGQNFRKGRHERYGGDQENCGAVHFHHFQQPNYQTLRRTSVILALLIEKEWI